MGILEFLFISAVLFKIAMWAVNQANKEIAKINNEKENK
jgi:hypothetical protein